MKEKKAKTVKDPKEKKVSKEDLQVFKKFIRFLAEENGVRYTPHPDDAVED